MTKDEKALVTWARRTRADENCEPRTNYFAQLQLDRVQRAISARKIESETVRRYGRKPSRRDFCDDKSFAAALNRFWEALDRVMCEAVLSSADASLTTRAKARKLLWELDRLEGKGSESASLPPSLAVAPTRERPDGENKSDPTKLAEGENDRSALQRFLDSLGEEQSEPKRGSEQS